MKSVRDALNILISIVLLAFIGLSLFRLGVFLLQSQHLI